MDQDRDLRSEPRLDLARPELRDVLDRYVHPTVLLVGRRKEQWKALGNELRAHGWHVLGCEGPARRRCPLLEGRHCPLRKSADTSVVFVEEIETPQALSSPKVACAAHGGPAVVVVDGSFAPPRTRGRFTVMGGLRSIQEIRRAVESGRFRR